MEDKAKEKEKLYLNQILGSMVGGAIGDALGYVITEISYDLCHGCLMSEYDSYKDDRWLEKYGNWDYR